MIKFGYLIVLLAFFSATSHAQYSIELHPIDNLDNLGLVHHPQILKMLDLKGRVYTIRIDETRFIRQGNRWIEGRRNVRFTALFDEKGRLREESQYSTTSDLVRRSGFVPNPNGGPEVYQVARSRIQNLWSSTPSFGSQDRILSEDIVLENGQTEQRVHTWRENYLLESRNSTTSERFSYDFHGNLQKIEIKHENEPLILRQVFRDDLGRIQRIEWYQDGKLVAHSNLLWNQDTLISQEVFQEGKNYLVEYGLVDAMGNWQRKVISEITPNQEKVPLFTRYRRITYY